MVKIQDKPLLIFSMAVDPTTKRAVTSGNISSQDALAILQRIVISQIQQVKNNGVEVN